MWRWCLPRLQLTPVPIARMRRRIASRLPPFPGNGMPPMTGHTTVRFQTAVIHTPMS